MAILSFTPRAPEPPIQRAGEALRTAKEHDRAGRLDHAMADFGEAIQLSEKSGEKPILIEALRRLGVIHQRRNNRDMAGDLCRRSYTLADKDGDRRQAGEALNALGGFDFEAGEMPAARRHLERAMALAGSSVELLGRIEQNLGVLASVQGETEAAMAHYGRAVQAFEETGSIRDLALVGYNMALIARAQGQPDLAASRLAKSADLAKSQGALHLEGLCHLGQAEASHERQQFAAAKTSVLRALEIFELLDLPLDRSAAHRTLGMVYRETGKSREAAHQFRRAVKLAEETGWMLGEAEALREMARLNEQSGCRSEAVTLLTSAYGLFEHVEARNEVADIARRLSELAAA
jgi:tetratricopeptide (TPR) repeat protein